MFNFPCYHLLIIDIFNNVSIKVTTLPLNFHQLQSVSSGTHKKVPTIDFSMHISVLNSPPPLPPDKVAFGEITFTVEVIVLLENIIMAVVNIVLGARGE